MSKEYKFIDLFAGCGGLSLGASRAGFSGKLAIEYQENAFKTLQHNLINSKRDEKRYKSGVLSFDWPEEIEQKNHDINLFLKEHGSYLKGLRGEIDLIVGGPPCQGFSNAGKRKEADPRNQLYKSYLSFVELVEPKILLIENVAGIASKFSKTSKSYKDNIIANLQKDYHVDGELLTSNIFGVPQKRKRYIIIGFKKTAFKDKEIDISEVFKKIKADSISFTSKYSIAKDSETFDITNTNVVQALSDISRSRKTPKPYIDENAKLKAYTTFEYSKGKLSSYQRLMRYSMNGEKYPDSHRIGDHKKDTIFKYQTLIDITRQNPDRVSFNFKPEEFEKAKWKSKKQIVNVLKEQLPSPTITTCPFDYIHYKEPRILTVREFARIQSFPDWFEFKGVYALSGSDSYKTPRYSQIGNAVPPLMAESIIKTLKSFL
jgi:DNA (cytosine-5)-methyltransferase 1